MTIPSSPWHMQTKHKEAASTTGGEEGGKKRAIYHYRALRALKCGYTSHNGFRSSQEKRGGGGGGGGEIRGGGERGGARTPLSANCQWRERGRKGLLKKMGLPRYIFLEELTLWNVVSHVF